MNLIETRTLDSVITDKEIKTPIWITTKGKILDGHHRYYAHLKYGLPLPFRMFEMQELEYVDREKLIFTRPFGEYDNGDYEKVKFKPIVVTRDSGLFVVQIGNNRVYRNKNQFVLAQVIAEY